MFSAAPDSHWETLEMIAEGDKISIFQEWKGTLIGEYQGIKGKGQPITRLISSVYALKDGKVIGGLTRIVVDDLSLYQQIGALPSTEEIIKTYNDALK